MIGRAFGRSPVDGMTPSSYCRLLSSTVANAMRPTASTTSKANGHHRRSTNGRICWAQAMGENQDTALPELLMTSPIPRTSAASASMPIAAPVAVRACRQSWAVTAATAPNTIDTPVTPRHIAAVSTTAKPVAAIASVIATARTALTPPTRINAAYVRA